MDNWTLLALVTGAALVALDLVVPSGGVLSGVGIALLIERGLDALGVASSVRWPMAGVGMLLTVGLAIRFGERLSEALFPARTRTNIDRLIGMRGEIRRIGPHGPVVELEGDLWTAALAEGSAPAVEGACVVVEAFEQQVPLVRVLDAG